MRFSSAFVEGFWDGLALGPLWRVLSRWRRMMQAGEPLTADERAFAAGALEADHGHKHYEPECPGCTAYRKLAK
jgi:hypothetical protein